MFAQFIEKYPPAIIIKLTRDCKTQGEFDDFIKKMYDIYNRNKMFNLLIDTQNVKNFGISYPIQFAYFLLKVKPLTKKYVKKSAIVLSSPFMEKIVNIVFKISPPTSDMIITRDLKDALIHVIDNDENDDDIISKPVQVNNKSIENI